MIEKPPVSGLAKKNLRLSAGTDDMCLIEFSTKLAEPITK